MVNTEAERISPNNLKWELEDIRERLYNMDVAYDK